VLAPTCIASSPSAGGFRCASADTGISQKSQAWLKADVEVMPMTRAISVPGSRITDTKASNLLGHRRSRRGHPSPTARRTAPPPAPTAQTAQNARTSAKPGPPTTRLSTRITSRRPTVVRRSYRIAGGDVIPQGMAERPINSSTTAGEKVRLSAGCSRASDPRHLAATRGRREPSSALVFRLRGAALAV